MKRIDYFTNFKIYVNGNISTVDDRAARDLEVGTRGGTERRVMFVRSFRAVHSLTEAHTGRELCRVPLFFTFLFET